MALRSFLLDQCRAAAVKSWLFLKLVIWNHKKICARPVGESCQRLVAKLQDSALRVLIWHIYIRNLIRLIK